ncbi:MAG: tetratricopeptide repeat protein, partial [Gemmatimonadetes bacterium]|nr:tetratricopeptide repeat protein [Gemmatimonadota bacterium]
LALEHRIQSIPAVKLYKNGEVIDEFLGVQPESVIRALLDRHIERESDRPRAAAAAALARGDAGAAERLLRQALEMDPDNQRLHPDLAGVLVQEGRFDEAHEIIADLPAQRQLDDDISKLRIRIDFARVAHAAPEEAMLKRLIDADPGDCEARYQLSARLIMDGRFDPALEQLMEIIRRDRKYRDQWDRWRKAGSDAAMKPDRDLELETLTGVLDGQILVHNHCYRGDEMAIMIDIAKEFGYRISSFHHAVESYKIRDLLARDGICSSMWADWWGFKLEAYDGIQQNIALVHEAGACAIVHSDDPQGIQRLNQEASKAMTAGNAMGMKITREDAIRWITLNPAKALGIDRVTGSIEAGKNADVVIWSGDPFSIYSKAEKVFVDGALVFDRSDPNTQVSDFGLGVLPRKVTR